MPKKKGLGRGLDALLPDWEQFESGTEGYRLLDPMEIRPNPFQPRKSMREEALEELADSIRQRGIIQPLIVRDTDHGYELIAGERRLRAALLTKMDRVPVIVKDVAPGEALELALIENIQRQDLNPIEEADAYSRLIDEFGLTQEALAERVGKKRATVANYLRLRNLPDPVKQDLSDSTLTMGHARSLLGLESRADIMSVRNEIIKKGLSVRATEQRVARIKGHSSPKTDGDRKQKNELLFKDLSRDLSRRFGTHVSIRKTARKGRIQIEFYSDQDLDRIISLLRPN
jgi:ParB family transcriptional regulator, chromosome partitioning protein